MRMKPARLALIGDRSETVVAHRAIALSIELAAQSLNSPIEPVWIDTVACEQSRFDEFHGFWCVPGSPYHSMDGALRAIRHARESHLPFLGTCGGFQHALIEYARYVRGWSEADHAETNDLGSLLLISRLACSLAEGRGSVIFSERSRIRELYGMGQATERYNCNFGLNLKFAASLQDQQLKFTAFDSNGEVRAFELVDYPFYMGTLYQPERAALEGNLHPLIEAFLRATIAFGAQ